MIEINSKRELQNELKKSPKIVACFCASWCPFCDRFNPVFDHYAARSNPEIFIRVFVDEDSNPLWEDYSLESVPTLVLFENGNVASRLDGGLGAGINEKQFADWLRKRR
jgi:thiol-disulfide isomerase/thioredoxin